MRILRGVFMLTRTCKITLLCAGPFLSFFFVLCSAAAAFPSSGEQMVNKLPDDTIAFAASSGGSELDSAFRKTILGKIWHDPNVQTFVNSIKNEIISKIQSEEQDPNFSKTADDIFSLIKLSLKQPFVTGIARDKTNKDFPVYYFAIIDAQNKISEISKSLAKLEAYAPKGQIVDVNVGASKLHWIADSNDLPGYWGFMGNYLVFAINDKSGLAVKYLKSTRTAAYLANLPAGNDALIFHIDFQKSAEIIKSVSSEEGNEDDIKIISSVMKELGLADIKNFTSRTSFEGSDVVENSLLEYNGLRKGIMASLKSIDISMLDFVDSDAVSVTAFNVSLSGIYDSIMNSIKVASPNDVYPEALKALAEAESEIGFNIRKDLLASLAGPTVIYSLPSQMPSASLTGGAVLISKLSNAQSFEKSMTNFGDFVAKSTDNSVQFSRRIVNGRTYYSFGILQLSMMQIIPTWTIADNKLVAAANPALCEASVARLTDTSRSANSIRTKEGFKKAAVGLGLNPVFFNYTDSKIKFNETYSVFQQFWPTIVMMASEAGLRLPWMLPSLYEITEQIQPSFNYIWFDGKGLHSHYQGSGTEPSLTSGIAVAGVAMGALMPALVRARSLAQTVVAGTNLATIGKCLILYANENDGNYPPDLKTLIEKEGLSPKTLESPRKPKDFTGPSFIYITGQNSLSDPENILAYENTEFCTEKINVLYNDGHVASVEPDTFKEELKETYKRLGREMPVKK